MRVQHSEGISASLISTQRSADFFCRCQGHWWRKMDSPPPFTRLQLQKITSLKILYKRLLILSRVDRGQACYVKRGLFRAAQEVKYHLGDEDAGAHPLPAGLAPAPLPALPHVCFKLKWNSKCKMFLG